MLPQVGVCDGHVPHPSILALFFFGGGVFLQCRHMSREWREGDKRLKTPDLSSTDFTLISVLYT